MPALNLPLSAYDDDTQAIVQIMRSADYLWLCFTELKTGLVSPGAYVGVRGRCDNSRDANAQAGCWLLCR